VSGRAGSDRVTEVHRAMGGGEQNVRRTASDRTSDRAALDGGSGGGGGGGGSGSGGGGGKPEGRYGTALSGGAMPAGGFQEGLPILPSQLKLSVGSGIEDVVSKSLRPIRTVQSETLADRLAGNPTGSRPLSN